MEFQEIIIAGIIIIVVALIASFIFSPADESHATEIQILNKGDFGENSTVYIKLTDNAKSALSDKTVHVKLIDKKGKVVYKKDVETHATGVAIAKLSNVSPGKYTINITFDGDENYTASSISKKVTVKGEEVVDEIVNATDLDDSTLQDIANSQQTSSGSYSQQSSSYTPSHTSTSSDTPVQEDTSEAYYDENGKEYVPTFDENGEEITPT